MILAITGNIASGKSSVARELQRRGAVVVDADQLAREVVAPGGAVLQKLVEAFGREIVQADGTLDRTLLGRRIFADGKARDRLNSIIHPAIAEVSVRRLRQLKEEGHPLVVYEAPLLYEAGAETRVDKVVVVTVTSEVQLQRLMERDGFDRSSACQRMDAQMPQQEKISRADYLIDNSGTWEQTLAQIDRLWPQWIEGEGNGG